MGPSSTLSWPAISSALAVVISLGILMFAIAVDDIDQYAGIALVVAVNAVAMAMLALRDR